MYDRLGNQCGSEPIEQQVRQIFKHIALLCENLDSNGLNEEQASYIDYELTMLYNTLSNFPLYILLNFLVNISFFLIIFFFLINCISLLN